MGERIIPSVTNTLKLFFENIVRVRITSTVKINSYVLCTVYFAGDSIWFGGTEEYQKAKNNSNKTHHQ